MHFIYFEATCKFRIIVSARVSEHFFQLWIALFFFSTAFFLLNCTFADFKVATSVYFWFVFAWYKSFYPFTFLISVSLYWTCLSYKQQMICCFFFKSSVLFVFQSEYLICLCLTQLLIYLALGLSSYCLFSLCSTYFLLLFSPFLPTWNYMPSKK